MTGVLKDDRVVVADPAEASTLHNRGVYGRPLSGGGLELDLVEACFLVELGRLEVEDASLVDLVVRGGRARDGFEIIYLVYRDLRTRGFVVTLEQAEAEAEAEAEDPDADPAEGRDAPATRFSVYPRGEGPKDAEPKAVVVPLSERAAFRLDDLLADVDRAAADDAPRPLYALVDEEGDLTYYRVEDVDLAAAAAAEAAGSSAAAGAAPLDGEAVLLADRALVPDADLGHRLHEQGFYGRFVDDVLQVSLVEAAHLQADRGLRVRDGATGDAVGADELRRRAAEVQPDFDLRLRAYRALRAQGLVVKTGFKYGAHFRVYAGHPEEGHAEWLVHALPAGFRGDWPDVAGFVRMAHSVRKTMVFARVAEEGAGTVEGTEEATEEKDEADGEGPALRTVALARARP